MVALPALRANWKTQDYEVSAAVKPANRNWFYVLDFARAVESGAAPTNPASPRSTPGPVVRSSSSSSTYDTLIGAEIVAMSGDPALKTVGRQGGLRGSLLAEDVATGEWRTWSYVVSPEPRPRNKNWFTVEEFLTRVLGR